MTIRRAMPVVVAADLPASRDFYESFLGFEAVMDEEGFLMLASPSTPTTQMIVSARDGETMDPGVRDVDISIEVRDVDAAHADAKRRGLEIVYPASGSLRVEPPIALVDRNVKRRGTKELSDDYLAFVFSPAGQRIGAELFYRQSDSAVTKEFEDRLPKLSMFSLEDVGIDWDIAMKRFFASGALVDQIAEDSAGVAR